MMVPFNYKEVPVRSGLCIVARHGYAAGEFQRMVRMMEQAGIIAPGEVFVTHPGGALLGRQFDMVVFPDSVVWETPPGHERDNVCGYLGHLKTKVRPGGAFIAL